MAEVRLVDIKKIYPNQGGTKKKKGDVPEKKHNLQITEEGVVAVQQFSLDIADREFIVLVGPSGCGKSTTLRMIAGLEEITSGDLFIDGKRMNDVAPKDRDIAMVFQNYALYPHMTVYENMAFSLKLKKLPKAEIDKKVREAAEILDITALLDRKPKALSGGQRQRVAIGRAIVRSPKVFLMDEPLSNLDAKLRVDMRNEIRRIQQQAGITAVYVTHDQSEAMALSDNIIIMKKGLIDQVGDPHTVYYHPVDEFVADFIGESNFLRGALAKKDGDAGLASIEGHEVEVASVGHLSEGDPCVLVLRPEAATLADEGCLPCRVTLSRFMGNYQNYQVMVGDTLVKITDFNPKNHKIYEVGDEAFVKFGPEDVHVL